MLTDVDIECERIKERKNSAAADDDGEKLSLSLSLLQPFTYKVHSAARSTKNYQKNNNQCKKHSFFRQLELKEQR